MKSFWVGPLLPLGVFVLLAPGLGRWSRLAAALAVLATTGSAVVAIAALASIAGGARDRIIVPWLDAGGRSLTLAVRLDPLGAVAATLVAVVGLAILVYAVGYMPADRRRGRFFAVMSFFIGSMLALVQAADLVTLFIAWELVGVCSYLLIGFWSERQGVGAAATKAFVTTRIGDLAMLLGVLSLVGIAGTGRIDALIDVANHPGVAMPLAAAVLLVLAGAAAKSAQVPFQGWLPDVMVGPAPVSALLHSATMVAAGAFLVAQLHPLLLAVPAALPVVASIGIMTALLGGLAAVVERDLKRTLAYSTMSHVGLMFVALGAGSVAAALFVLIGHAFYKALLFLAVGAIDHQVGTTDLARLGGLRSRMPWTSVVFVLGAAAMAGLPVTLALPPEDAALAAVWKTGTTLFAFALVTTFLSALYSARLVGLVVLGPSSPEVRDATEEPALLAPLLVFASAMPLVLLANAEILGRPLDRLLGMGSPEMPVVTIAALATVIGGAALGLGAVRRWPRAVVWPPLSAIAPVFSDEFGLRHVYRSVRTIGFAIAKAAGVVDHHVFDAVAGRAAAGVLAMVRAAGSFDHHVFDAIAGRAAAGALGIVKVAGRADRELFDAVATRAASATAAAVVGAGRFDVQRFDRAIDALSRLVLRAGERMRVLQTGRIENYLMVAFGWALTVLGVAALAAAKG